MPSKTIQRSVKYLKDNGYLVQIVERWNHFAKVRQDMFGWIDIVAVKPGKPILGVQTTTGNMAAVRLDKARGNEALKAWISGGGQLVVHSWDKRGPRGKRKVWTVVERWVSMSDLESVPQLQASEGLVQDGQVSTPVGGGGGVDSLSTTGI